MVEVKEYLRLERGVNSITRVGYEQPYTAGASLLRPMVKKKREIN